MISLNPEADASDLISTAAVGVPGGHNNKKCSSLFFIVSPPPSFKTASVPGAEISMESSDELENVLQAAEQVRIRTVYMLSSVLRTQIL